MKGLELARKYYEKYGKEMLEKEFSGVLPYLAVGFVGSGSECYGFDDKTSQDHDFEPAFCIFLPGEDIIDRRTAFLLERAYAKLPKEFMGYERSALNPVGGNRHGVIRMDEFFASKTGSANGELSVQQWLSLPEYSLLEATNGEVFEDKFGKFTAIREKLSCLPQDVRLKKLAGYLLLMGQSGQYNYERCIKRGETAAAQMAVFEFIQSTLHAIYLLNNAYMPYYKWCFRGLKNLSKLNMLADDLEFLISSGNTENEYEIKIAKIESICTSVADELRSQCLTNLDNNEMEQLAYAINEIITDNNIRNLHILYGV